MIILAIWLLEFSLQTFWLIMNVCQWEFVSILSSFDRHCSLMACIHERLTCCTDQGSSNSGAQTVKTSLTGLHHNRCFAISLCILGVSFVVKARQSNKLPYSANFWGAKLSQSSLIDYWYPGSAKVRIHKNIIELLTLTTKHFCSSCAINCNNGSGSTLLFW